MRRLAAILLFCTLTGAAAAGQTQAPSAPQQPVFRSTTQVVEVTVVVRGKDGAFVRDLTIDDFAVTEDGAPQQIQTLYLVEGPRGRMTQGAAVAPSPGLIGDAPAAPAARRAFVFYFDMEQISPGGLTRAREAVESFATQRLFPTDISGLVAAGLRDGRLSGDHLATLKAAETLKPRADKAARDQALRQWPRIISPVEAEGIARNDEQVLVEARDRACQERGIDCVTPEADPDAAPAPTGGRGQAMDQSEVERQLIENELRQKATLYIAESRASAERSVGGLMQIATALERIPGRKTIVWVTEGTWSGEIAERAREAAYRASQSGVAIYTIDPRGLDRNSGANLDSVAAADVGVAFLQDQDDIANVMATGSGGRAIRNENNLVRALDIIEDDTSTYYVVGYSPSDAGDRSKGRKLKVDVTREGLDARVRHGFMAPQRVGESTAPVAAPAPAAPPVAAPAPAPTEPGVAPAPAERREPADPREPGTEPREPSEPMEPAEPGVPGEPVAPPIDAPAPGVRSDSAARVAELSAGADASGRDSGSEGWQAYQRGDLEAALPLLENSAARQGSPAWVHYALGFTYVGLNRPMNALASWQRVLSAAPGFEPVYLDLATTYTQVRDYDRALSVLKAAAKRWPADPEVHNGTGFVLIRRRAYADAIVAFGEATRLAPKDPVGWLNLGRAHELRYLANRRYIKAINQWIGPDSDRQKAREYYERCLKLGGPYAEQAADAIARLKWTEK